MKKHIDLSNKITVKQAADFLILTHGSATLQSVYRRLVQQGNTLDTFAVSNLLELIAFEQGWDKIQKKEKELYYSLPRPKNERAWFCFSLN